MKSKEEIIAAKKAELAALQTMADSSASLLQVLNELTRMLAALNDGAVELGPALAKWDEAFAAARQLRAGDSFVAVPR